MNDLYTRFRVYPVEGRGYSMSYVVDSMMVLIEARYNDSNASKIRKELELTGMDHIALLHISHWDENRCRAEELENLLKSLSPSEIEIPAAIPDTDEMKQCKRIVQQYCNDNPYVSCFECSSSTLKNPCELPDAKFIDLILSPVPKNGKKESTVVKLFQEGKFSVLNASRSNLAEQVTTDLVDAGLPHSVDVLVTETSLEEKEPFISKLFITNIHPRIVIMLGNSVKVYQAKGVSMKDFGISVVCNDNEGIIIKYGGPQKKQDPKNDSSVLVGSDEYVNVK